MTPDAIGSSLAARLHAAESAIDAALSETAALMGMLPSARAGASLSGVTGQQAIDGAALSVAALISARSHIVDTHNTLAELARRMGLDDLAVGPLDKPEDGERKGVAGPLEAAHRPTLVIK